MEVKAKGKYLKISSKKMRMVTELIKGMDLNEALDYLNFVPQKATRFISKILKSALSNAEHNFDLKKENLFIKRIFVNEGPTLKRWRPRAFGRAGQIRKRSSHLEIILEEKAPSQKLESKKEKLKEPEIKPLSEAEEVVAKDKESQTSAEPVAKPRSEKQSKPKGKKVFRNIFRRKSI